MTPEQNIEEEQACRAVTVGPEQKAGPTVVDPGTVIEDEEGGKATVERGSAVSNHLTLYMVQEDYDGCLARFQDGDA